MLATREEEEAAAEAASWALHRGQTDKAGNEYYLHPLAVAQEVERQARGRGWDKDKTSIAVQVALLHDVLEDVEGVTERDLMHRVGVNHKATELVVAMSFRYKDPEETRSDYYARLKSHPYRETLMLVKRADIEHNMRPDRLAALDAETRERLIEKYAKAYTELGL